MSRSVLVVNADARALPLPDNSVDAIVCDPPYGLEFMGKEWDRFSGAVTDRNFKGFVLPAQRTRNVKCPDCNRWAYDHPGRRCECGGVRRSQVAVFQAWCEQWAAEALRVLKPGGWLLAFGGARTWHRLTCGIEDAGFELRDQEAVFGPLAWLYGSGFPKSKDADRAVDMELCQLPGRHYANALPAEAKRWPDDHVCPDTPEGDQWAGWGTALKPAWEPIVVARKPLAGTVAATVLEHGTGALNIDATRIEGAWTTWRRSDGTISPGVGASSPAPMDRDGGKGRATERNPEHPAGRWPANVALVHDARCQPVGTRKVRGIAPPGRPSRGGPQQNNVYGRLAANSEMTRYADPDGTETVEAWDCAEGCPVALLDQQSATQRAGRPAGSHPRRNTAEAHNHTASMGQSSGDWQSSGHADDQGGASRFFPSFQGEPQPRLFYTAKAPGQERLTIDGVSHPTVKPLELMRWLVRLVTPPGGIVLDMFCGSGTTGEAAMLEGFRAVVCDTDMVSCRAAVVRSDPFVRRRRKIVTTEQGKAVEAGEADAPRLF